VATLGVLASVNAVAGVPIGFAAGYIMDRFGRKKTIVPGFSLIFATTVFVTSTALFQLPFEVFAVAYFLFNAALALAGGSMQVLGSDLAPAYARGRFFAILRLAGEGGTTLSPVLLAGLATIHYALAFGVLSLAALGVVLIIGLGLRETVNLERPPAVSTSGPPGPAA
jgi:MFS family permease